VQSKGVTYSVKRTDLKAMRKVDVPVGQVLTKEEYYNELRAQIQPGGEADKHVQLAEQLMRVRNYDRALEHVEQDRRASSTTARTRRTSSRCRPSWCASRKPRRS
jgi:hypothetical protein